jgi:hypothetical protein
MIDLPRLIFKPPNYSRFSVGALYVSKMTSDFKGEIDEINIWNMALSSDKIPDELEIENTVPVKWEISRKELLKNGI